MPADKTIKITKKTSKTYYFKHFNNCNIKLLYEMISLIILDLNYFLKFLLDNSDLFLCTSGNITHQITHG